MKSKDEVMSQFLVTLAELQSGTVLVYSDLWEYLVTKLEVLNDILQDDVPDEYWEQVSEFLE